MHERGCQPEHSEGSQVAMHESLKLAKKALVYFLKTGLYFKPPENSLLSKQKSSGVFVCLKKEGRLRGCMGTIKSTKPTLAEEIIYNTVLAGTADPRFPAVQLHELDQLKFAVDILSIPEPTTFNELNPKVYGLIVASGPKVGLLLPNLEGVKTSEEQLRIAKLKAGLSDDEPYQLYKFTVQRFEE